MSKDGSGRSSAAGSLHANSPDVDAEPTAPELQTPVDPVSATAQKVPSDEDMKKPSTTPTVPERATESQPMTASNSTSSHLSAKDASNAIGSNVPYGTRSSRNRTGAARPNYAEDKELDVEFEAVSTKDNSGRKGKSTSEQSNGHSSKADYYQRAYPGDINILRQASYLISCKPALKEEESDIPGQYLLISASSSVSGRICFPSNDSQGKHGK